MMTGLKRKALRVLTITAALLLVCAMAAAATYPFLSVTTDSVRVRASASLKSVALDTLDSGTPVQVNGKTGNFFKVSYNNGKTGYIQADFVSTDASVVSTPTPEPVETVPSYPYETVTRDSVNLRSGRSVRAVLLRKIPKGAKITVTANSGTWASVTYGNYSGYVKNEYIVLKEVKKVRPTAEPTPVPTLSPEESAGGYDVLQKGGSGSAVKALQQALIELGFLTGTADGKFGAGTEKAVIAFQQANDYPATGIVDANLQAFLYSGKPKNSAGTAKKINTLSPAEGATMKLNCTGDAVGALQTKLALLGYYNGAINNTYDAATKKAVIAFQKKHGLTADGIAGATTQKEIAAATPESENATPTVAPTATPTPVPTFTVPAATVKRDSQGADAKLVQKRLKELGYYRGVIDGKFGFNSVKALKKFQEMNSLEQDGVAGPGTYKILFSLNAIPAAGLPTATPTAIPDPDATPEAEPTPEVTYETLRKGATGDAVALMQEALINLGYLTGTADGNFGANTVTAVKKFQRANGLTADGDAGTLTLQKLYGTDAKPAATPKPTAAPTATPAPASTLLKIGARGNEVKNLQATLIKLGYLTGSADGIFGSKTANALKEFQKNNGLSADGIAGNKTLTALNSSSAKPASGSTAGNTGTAAGGNTPKTGTVTRPDASKVIYANWYTTVKSVAKKYPYVTVYDFSTGISWQAHIFSVGAHADCEPLTANDTAKLERAFGGNTWNAKAVWVIFADGSIYMASTHSMPHEVQHITDNNFAGHCCIHFPRTQAQVEAIGTYATSHQAAIDKGWATTQGMIR